MRTLDYASSINEAMHQAMDMSSDVIVLGQLIDYKSGVFGTTTGLAEKFGLKRVQDFPVAEGVMTAAAAGAALGGLRPVLVHQRLDFMLYSMDAIVNWLSLWRFKSNRKSNLPVTIRAIVGKGWGQGPQHSKSLHAWFAHLPGIKVVVPSTAYDAKGLLLESIFGESPTVFIEHRSLFSMVDEVPDLPYRIRFGQAIIRREGSDVTMVAMGVTVPMALKAATSLGEQAVNIEVIDLRTVSPIDYQTIFDSVYRTRRLVVADPGWQSVGLASEIIASVSEKMGRDLLSNPIRICLPDSHTPMSSKLESEYYPDETDLISAVTDMVSK